MMKNEGVCYLTMGIGLPVITRPAAPHEQSARNAGNELGCDISSVYLLRENSVLENDEYSRADGRYLLTFPGGVADDERARQIADALALSWILLMGPVAHPEDLASIYRFPADMVQEDRYVSIDALLAYDESLPFEKQFPFPGLQVVAHYHISEDQMMRLWALVPVVIDEPMFSAVRHLAASFREFYVFPGQVPEVLGQPGEMPDTANFLTRAENALVNAFKAVEALIGDPPSDDRKFFAKLRSVGVDPFQNVGYRSSVPLHQRIRELNRARDKKGAHAKTSATPITSYELMDLQLCARLVVIGALERKLCRSIFD